MAIETITSDFIRNENSASHYGVHFKAPHEPSQLASWLELFKLSQAEPR
jgi:hypothetical protein